MLPTPAHLRGCTVATPDAADEDEYAALVRCPCGGESFRMLHTADTKQYAGETIPCVTRTDDGFFLRIVAACVGCASEHLLLDMDLHGWNGFVCREPRKTARPRPPLVAWRCRKCGTKAFGAAVSVRGEGKQDAISEADGLLDETNWHEGFGWVTVDLRCDGCGDGHATWIDYETM